MKTVRIRSIEHKGNSETVYVKPASKLTGKSFDGYKHYEMMKGLGVSIDEIETLSFSELWKPQKCSL